MNNSRFEFLSIHSEEAFKSLRSLVKHNDGLFKSRGQAFYVHRNVVEDFKREPYQVRQWFGFDVKPEHVLCHVSAQMVWSTGEERRIGRNSYRRVEWFFVVDQAGVVAQYKLHFTYHGKGGDASEVNPAKTECVWSRTPEIEAKAKALADQFAREDEQRQKERDEFDANRQPAPQGRHVVEGKVISTRQQPDPYSYHGGSIYKMLVEDDRGFRVWSTIPSAILSARGGSRVRFTATLSPKTDDPLFAIAKRPTKAEFASK